jgi:hypothetical protein
MAGDTGMESPFSAVAEGRANERKACMKERGCVRLAVARGKEMMAGKRGDVSHSCGSASVERVSVVLDVQACLSGCTERG